MICPDCGSQNTSKKGFSNTVSNPKKQRYQCKDCGRKFLKPSDYTPHLVGVSRENLPGKYDILCPHCQSDNIRKSGFKGGKQSYECKKCWQKFYAKQEYQYKTLPDKPRALLLDIETAPMRVYTWHIFKPYLGPQNIITETYLLSWAAKWLCDSETMSDVLTPKEAIAGEDKRIAESMWKLLDEADILIAHNGKRFDIRVLNERYLFYDMPPPMPYQVIDTLKEMQRYFKLASHKQDYITKYLKLPHKLDTDFELWVKCMAGDKESLGYMEEYNRRDVGGLEEIYFKIRKWIKSHPNMGIYTESETQACPTCGHTDLDWQGYYTTPASRFRAFRCANCQAIGRSRYNDLNKTKIKENLLLPVAR